MVPLWRRSGLKDIILIANGNSVLAIHKDNAQQVKDVVIYLRKNGRQELL